MPGSWEFFSLLLLIGPGCNSPAFFCAFVFSSLFSETGIPDAVVFTGHPG